MQNVNNQSPAFKGVYKYTIPSAKELNPTEKEFKALEELDNEVFTTANEYGAKDSEIKGIPGQETVYFKIDDKHDADFENKFQDALKKCNATLNVDLANKAYIQKVSMDEYDKASSFKPL